MNWLLGLSLSLAGATLIADLKAIQLGHNRPSVHRGSQRGLRTCQLESPASVCEQLHRLGIPSLVLVPY